MSSKLFPGDRILVQIPNWLGDAVMSEPSLRRLHQWANSGETTSELSIAGPRKWLDLLAHGLPQARLMETAPTERENVQAWRGHDWALLLPNSFRSAWIAFRAGIPNRVGWIRDGRGALLTHGAAAPLERGGLAFGIGKSERWPRYLPRPFGTACGELLASIGLPLAETRPRLRASEVVRERVQQRLETRWPANNSKLVVLNAGGRPGAAKRAPTALWRSVLEALCAKAEMRFCIVCGPGEEAGLRSAFGGFDPARVDLWCEPAPTLEELLALLERADLFLGVDSGPRHLAQAAGTAQICLAGPSDPRHTADHLQRTKVMRLNVDCGPCHRERCEFEDSRALACLAHDPRELAIDALAQLG